MADDNQALLLQISADLRKLEKAFDKARGIVDRNSSSMEKRARRLAQNLEGATGSVDPTKRLNARLRGAQTQIAAVEQQMLRSSESIRTALLSSASAIAAGFGVIAITQLADAYTRFTNQLKVAGLEGSKLVSVQQQLFETAQKYGVTLESLGGLYGRTSQGAKELGASNTDLLRFTEGVAAALKVQGGSAESTQGAILQLSQALGGAIVRAEEFNSINEGARPILQAVADNIDRFGGSVAKLRADVILGKVTSQEFFQAFLKGVDGLKGKAEKAVLTISASLQVLNNALSKYIGEGDQTFSATAQLSGAIKALAENLDIVVPAIAVLATTIASRLVVSMGQSVVATVAQTVAQQRELIAAEALTVALNQQAAANARLVATGGAATASLRVQTASMGAATLAARGIGGALLGAFGGPVGLAITAVAVGLGAVAVASAQTDAKARALSQSIAATTESIEAEKIAASIAAQEQGKMPAAFEASEKATASLTDEVNKLGDAHYRAANAAKAQRLEEARTLAASAQKDADEAKGAADSDKKSRVQSAQFGNANLAGLNSDGRRLDGGETRRAAQAADASDLRRQADKAAANAAYRAQQVKEIENQKLDMFLPPKPASAGGGSGTGGGKKGGAADRENPLLAQVNSLYEKGLTDTERLQKQYREDVDVLNAAFAQGLISDLQRQIVQSRLTSNLDIAVNPVTDKKPLELGKIDIRDVEDTTKNADAIVLAISPIKDTYNQIADAAEYSFARAGGSMTDFATLFTQELQQMAAAWAASKIGDSIFGQRDSNGDRSGGLLSFDGGGYTGSGARAGGLDGKGGFPAVLHPNETVFDHTKGLRNVSPVGGSRGGTMSLTLHSTYQIEGAIGKDEIAGAIRRAHDSAVSSAVDIGRRQLPGSMAKLNKYGTT